MFGKSLLDFLATEISINLQFTSYIFFRKLNYDNHYWQRQNIQVLSPNLISGNIKDFLKGMHKFDMKLKARFGPTYG